MAQISVPRSTILTLLLSPTENGVVTLKEILEDIEAHESQYAEREILVAMAVGIAKVLGYKAGVRFDTSSDEAQKWPVWCIELPGIGEVSWHSPAYEGIYDGYSTEEKYRRCREFISHK